MIDVEQHDWQEFNAHGNTCHAPGCTLNEDEHPRRMTTYEEWRVTGTDDEGDPVSVTFHHDEHEPEDGARTFQAWAAVQEWRDGPHLHQRTVAVTEWEDA